MDTVPNWSVASLLLDSVHLSRPLKRKLMSLSHGQELGQLADLASDWFFTFV